MFPPEARERQQKLFNALLTVIVDEGAVIDGVTQIHASDIAHVLLTLMAFFLHESPDFKAPKTRRKLCALFGERLNEAIAGFLEEGAMKTSGFQTRYDAKET